MDRIKLSEISKNIFSGLTPLRSNNLFWKDGSIPWLKTEQLGKEKYIYDTNEKISDEALSETSIKLCPINTLSIAMYGEGKTRGSVSIIKNEMTTNQACCNITIDEDKADYEFVYYFLKTQYEQLRNLSSGVRKNLNSNDIKNFEIRLPRELKTQQTIASILSTLDKKIELNNQINQKLEAMAKTLYDYWFVQFDFPFDFVQGKPDANGKPYKSSGGKMVYSEELKREIPDRWEVKDIKNNDFTKIIKPSISNFDGEKIYLATADVKNNNINFQAETITYLRRPSRANMQIIPNSIWFAKMKNSKKVLYIGDYSKEFIDNFILSTGFMGLEVKENALEYLWGFINNNHFEIIKDKLANGATQEAINNDDLSFIKILIPTKDILNLYNLKTKSIYKKTYINQVETQKLTQLRDWLLPMLMNGQVTVADAKEQIDELMVAEPSVGYGE